MNTLLSTLVTLFAEDSAAGEPKAQQGSNPLIFIIQMVVFFGAFMYFILYLPQRRERARQAALLAGVKKNDRVLTSSGILGVVVSVNKDARPPEVTLRIDETTNAKLHVALNTIAQILVAEQPAETPSK